MNKYIDLLKSKHLTVTPQRLEIVNLFSQQIHLNIDQLYKLVHKSFPSISLATVYKNINIMLEKNFLMEIQIPGKKSIYELVKDEHSHLTCMKCNEIIDIFLDTSELYAEAESLSDFKLQSSSIVFTGVCASCQEAS
jgi:Fur family peroxide stress response transcriptional regulator